jgi:hypothetical protein
MNEFWHKPITRLSFIEERLNLLRLFDPRYEMK